MRQVTERRDAWVDHYSIYHLIPVIIVLSGLFSLLGCSALSLFSESNICQDELGCVEIAPGQPLKLGALLTLTGGSSPAGIEQSQSIQLALSKRNNQLLGHPIELKIEDEHCSAEGGANAALRVVADSQVVAVFGTNCSSAAVTAGKILSSKGLVMISSANTAPALTSVGGSQGDNWVPGYFRTSWNDSFMGQAAAKFAYQELGLRKAAVINAGDTYTKGLTDVFSLTFKDLGGKVVLDATIDEEDTNQQPVINAIALNGAELVFFPLSHPEAGSRIVRLARKHPDLKDLAFIGGEGMLSEIFIREVGQYGEGVYILGPSSPATPQNDRIRQEYQAKFGQFPLSFYYNFSIDAVNITLDSIEKVARKETNGALSIGRQALRSAMYGVRNYPGLTGQLDCDRFGDCGMVAMNVLRLNSPEMTVEQLGKNVIKTYQSRQSNN